MTKEYRNFTAEEVLFIFKEEHRLCSRFDPEADSDIFITMDSSVEEWRYSMDLLDWKKLSNFLNTQFEINLELKEWEKALNPANERKMLNVCELIANNAKLEVIKPIQLFGNDCLSASLFRSIEKNLSKRGVDTKNLKPSSKIEPFLKSNFSEFIEQINKNFAGVIPEIQISTTKIDKLYGYIFMSFIVSLITLIFLKSIWIISLTLFVLVLIFGYLNKKTFNSKEGMMIIPEIETFRDLIEKIIEENTPHNRVDGREQ